MKISRRSLSLLCLSLAIAPLSFAQSSTINVGATATGIPFTFLNVKTNSIEGMMVDTVNAIAQDAGLTVEIQPTVFSALIPSLTSNKIDVISAAMVKTPARAQVVDFTLPVYSYGDGLIVSADDPTAYKSLDDLKGQIVGAQVGTIYLDILNNHGGFKEVRSYDSAADIARDLKLGRIKAGLGDQPIMAYQIKNNTFKDVKLAPDYQAVNVSDVCLIVRKGNTELLEKLNASITKLKANGALETIVQKWGI